MRTLKNANEKQKEAVNNILEEYQEHIRNKETTILTVGEVHSEPALIIVNQGDLGIAFVDKEGGISWLNIVGEHMLLQFLIDKQYSQNAVRNSKEMSAGGAEAVWS